MEACDFGHHGELHRTVTKEMKEEEASEKEDCKLHNTSTQPVYQQADTMNEARRRIGNVHTHAYTPTKRREKKITERYLRRSGLER